MEIYPNQTLNQPGTRLAVYKPGTGKIVLLGILLILIGLPCTIGGIMNNTSPTVSSNSSSSLEEWFITVGVGFALCGLIAVILALGNRKMRVDVYEQGFVARNKHGVQEVCWDQITHVWHKLEEIISTTVTDPKTGVVTPKTRKTSIDVYAVQCTDGTTCEVDTSFYGLSRFALMLEQTYPRYLFPRMLASYQAGASLPFGTLTVSASGVSNTQSDSEVQLTWRSFNAIEVDKKSGNITIRRGAESQSWSTISLTDTPDIAVFEALVNTIASQQ